MEYRPEYHLHRLRMTRKKWKKPAEHHDNNNDVAKHRHEVNNTNNEEKEEDDALVLRWLRTLVLDGSVARRDDGIDLQIKHSLAVERVICKELPGNALVGLLLTPLSGSSSRWPRITSLDFRDLRCSREDHETVQQLLLVMYHHQRSLRRLFLPEDSVISQSTLDCFSQLEELDVTWCASFTNVDFCSTTLRVLYASYCDNLTNEGLKNATRLEVLHVCGCSNVTSVAPFAHCLLELDASSTDWGDGCGLSSAALVDCRRLQVLFAEENETISTLAPFAQQLRELHAWESVLDDAALAEATGLVRLVANHKLTSVKPFGTSLRRLSVGNGMGTNKAQKDDDAAASGIDAATLANLVYLNVSHCSSTPFADANSSGGSSSSENRSSVAPFWPQLLELYVEGDAFEVRNGVVSLPTKLIWLRVTRNTQLSTVHSCSPSLRHLHTSNATSLTNEGLSTATKLITFHCWGNRFVTTLKPFQNRLQELVTDSQALEQEAGRAPPSCLHRLMVWEGKFGELLHGAQFQPNPWRGVVDDGSSMEWMRDTVTYEI